MAKRLWKILYEARYGEKWTPEHGTPSEMGLKDYRKGDVMIWMAWMLEYNLEADEESGTDVNEKLYDFLKDEVR